MLSNTKEQNTNGIGLGLVICQQISQQFIGDVYVYSLKGKGSVFGFDLALPPDFQPNINENFISFSREMES